MFKSNPKNSKKTITKVYLIYKIKLESKVINKIKAWIIIIIIIISTMGVSHYGLAIYIKNYLKAKEELWRLKNFTIHTKI
jgi:hypothetical protein